MDTWCIKRLLLGPYSELCSLPSTSSHLQGRSFPNICHSLLAIAIIIDTLLFNTFVFFVPPFSAKVEYAQLRQIMSIHPRSGTTYWALHWGVKQVQAEKRTRAQGRKKIATKRSPIAGHKVFSWLLRQHQPAVATAPALALVNIAYHPKPTIGWKYHLWTPIICPDCLGLQQPFFRMTLSTLPNTWYISVRPVHPDDEVDVSDTRFLKIEHEYILILVVRKQRWSG